MSDPLAKRQLDELYAELPTIDCQGKCQSACGPIGMTGVELRRIVKRTGREPTYDQTFTCSLLRNGLCSVYQIRPMICRLWGVVDALPCPWGCKPEPRYLTYLEGQEFLLRADDIGATQEELAANQRTREKLARMTDDEIELWKQAFVVPPKIE
jgi:hypothetical protein